MTSLRRRLDALYEELARERRRDDAEAEAAPLRAELERLGVARPRHVALAGLGVFDSSRHGSARGFET